MVHKKHLFNIALKKPLIFGGIGVALLYWILESFVDSYVFHSGPFIKQIVYPQAHDIWTRLLMISIFIIFSIYAQKILSFRKQAEEKSKLAYAELEQIFNIASSGMRVIDKDFNILKVNQTFLNLTGLSREQAMEKKCHQTLSCPLCSTDNCPLNKIFKGEESIECEMEKTRKDGSKLVCIITVTAFRDPRGNLAGIVEDIKDITDHRKADEQAKKQQQMLIQADKMVALGTLVSGVAHEIDNPNNFVMLNAKIINKVWSDVIPILKRHYQREGDFTLAELPYSESSEEIAKLISGIYEGSLRINKIVQSLKNFARKDKGNLNQKINIRNTIESAVLISNDLIKNSTHHFSVEYGKNMPIIIGNSQQLEQVIINLITNSCQALKNKNKKISISTYYDKDMDSNIIKVYDQGIGVSEEDLPHIMDPFFTTKRDMGGTGLGLSISFNIIQNFGGGLNFLSKPKKGTTATITLPVNHNKYKTDRMKKAIPKKIYSRAFKRHTIQKNIIHKI